MKIEIDLDLLEREKLTITEYCLLLFRYLDKPDYLKFIEYGFIITVDLETQGYIKILEDSSFVLRNKALQLFQNQVNNVDSKWQLFKSVFPIKEGKRRLHDQQDACKEKFNKLIKSNPDEFDKIINGLTNELEARRLSGAKREFFPAPKAMSVWLNQKHYLTYQEEIKEEPNQEKVEGI